MMNAHEPTADQIDVEDDKIGGMKWDEVTTKGYKGKIKFTNVINYSTNNISATVLFMKIEGFFNSNLYIFLLSTAILV